MTSTDERPRTGTKRRRLHLGGMGVETQSIIVTLLGGLLISITVSGRFTSYVRPGFKWLLLISGTILVVVGIVSLVLAVRADMKAGKPEKAAGEDTDGHDHGDDHGEDGGGDQGADDGQDGHGHDHSSSKAPWLILAPVLVLLLVAPPALGADAVARNAGSQGLAGYDAGAAGGTGTPAKTDVGGKDGTSGVSGGYAFNDGSGSVYDSSGGRRTMHFDPLPADPQLTMKEFVLRSLYDADRSLDNGTPVTVTGFIAPAGDGFDSGYTIARMSISCCAADANPLQLHVDGNAPYPSDTWVQAVVVNSPNTGTLDNGYVPTVTVNSIQTIDQPDDPYEH